MNLRPIIDDIAAQADDLLVGCKDRTQGRTTITEFLTLEHPRMPPSERRKVTDGVMAILEEESFFGERFVDSFDADQNLPDPEED